MNRERHVRNYDLHSWTGITLGLLVYLVCLTGSFALFYHEILTWEDPAYRLERVEKPVSINEKFTQWVEDNTQDEPADFVRITYPSEYSPYYSGGATFHDENGDHIFKSIRWDPKTGEELPKAKRGLSEWILDFHRDLMWPEEFGGRTAGRGLVGVIGVILMLSIITGVVAHTKIFQELFTLRFYRSMRLKWQDTHKVLGLWGLPFYAMISFTGAMLGVVVLLAPIVAFLTFKGDQEALFEAVLGKEEERTGVAAQMLSVDELKKLRQPESDEPVEFITFHNWGDETAHAEVFFHADTELAISEGFEISAVTGEKVKGNTFEEGTLGLRFTSAVAPLHYGTFGGISLKFLWFVLGISLAVITAMGNMMWIERRLHGNEGKRSPGFYKVLSHITVGVTMGFPLATVAIFYLDKLYMGAEASRLTWTGAVYFLTVAVSIVYAFLRRNDYGVVRELLIITGITAIGVPVVNAITTRDFFISVLLGDGHKAAAWVDLTFLLAGIAIALFAFLLPTRRSEKANTIRLKVAA